MSEPQPGETDDTPSSEEHGGTKPARFDEALAELEQLVETLEQGDLSLDQSLAHFERGVGLARECRESLEAAEQRVQILTQHDADDGDEATLDDFEPDRDAQ